MLTQDDYRLYTGQSVSYTEEEWQKIVKVAGLRLASFLCLDSLPELDDSNLDLAMLLANFIAAVIKFAGDGDSIQSKNVRNFTISFKSGNATNAFAQIMEQYDDIIAKYSKCDFGVAVEKARRCGCEFGRIGF